MRKLTSEQRELVLNHLVEGCSIRATSRLTGVSKNTITKFLRDFGAYCYAVSEMKLQNLDLRYVEVDEMHSFVFSKSKNTPNHRQHIAGTKWIWIAMCPETKLVFSILVGDRSLKCAKIFMKDVASKLKGRVQLTSDAFPAYPEAIEYAFGDDVDYAQIVKYTPNNPSNDNPPVIYTKVFSGNPDPAKISTSLIERQNLNFRMSNRRLTRKVNAFSKDLGCHRCMLAICAYYHNFIRIHQTLKITPAMEAGITNKIEDFKDVLFDYELYEMYNQWKAYSKKCEESGKKAMNMLRYYKRIWRI